MTPSKNDPQGLGSAITYQRRYALGAILGLNIEDDDDGNGASKTGEKPTQNATTSDKKDADNRPWLTEKQLDKIIARMKEGEDLFDTTVKAFRMKKEFKTKLENITK